MLYTHYSTTNAFHTTFKHIDVEKCLETFERFLISKTIIFTKVKSHSTNKEYLLTTLYNTSAIRIRNHKRYSLHNFSTLKYY